MQPDFDRIDTTPGCGDDFAPSQHPGDASGYLRWAKGQLRTSPWFKQRIALLAFGIHGGSMYFQRPQVSGEFADALLSLVRAVDKRCRDLSTAAVAA